MRTLDYQERVLGTLDAYLDVLKAQKVKADRIAKLAAEDPDLGLEVPDFCAKAWADLNAVKPLPVRKFKDGTVVPFSPRFDGIGRAVPNVTFKVPTGGGKTWLAVNAVSRIMGRYLGKNAGFVLWVVPNEAIYTQTLKRLKDRQHPYRQALDRAAAGRVKVMEKGDRLDARDVETHLCVMVLMLQAANRQTQETLRMFRDRGDVHGFFPPEGDQAAHAAEFEAVPNLDGYQGMFPMVKDSLGNALRKIRPVVVMDEGQKATSDLAHKTLYDFNPLFVLELTATPKDVTAKGGGARYANLLVEVTGRELHAEDMIKMPLNLEPRQGTDWRGTLTAALDRLNTLQAAADAYRADRGELSYIRPIMLVQVERTGKDQRDGVHIHAEDVKEWLLQAGLDEAQIAIKTAEQNDLSQPENQDLLSPANRVRVIVTKAALQEGWDCPFAYVLCSLAAASNLSAMTQLVGRTLRQPYALKTKVPALDECYVITHHAGTREVVEAIKAGLEKDGLADLVIEVPSGTGAATPGTPRRIERRAEFKSLKVYLPKVLCSDGGALRDLDYETDILSAIDWRDYDPSAVAQAIPENPLQAASQLQRISLTDGGSDYFRQEEIAAASETLRFDPSYAVRVISDLVPNPFVARSILGRMVDVLKARGLDDKKLGAASGVIVDALRLALDKERTARAEVLFKAGVKAGRIQFRLRLDGNNWVMPEAIATLEPELAPHMTGGDGGPLKRSLFSPVFRNELNTDEQGVAVHLDGEAAVKWWHRNVAKTNYGVQGWKRGRIYPDFIFATGCAGGSGRIVMLETKGDHLQNPDTDYKREVLDFLTKSFSWDQAVPAGQLQIAMTGETVECALVLMVDVPTRLPALIAG